MSNKIEEMAQRKVYSEEDLAKRKTPAQVIRENSSDDMYIETLDDGVRGIACVLRELEDMTISEEAVRKVIKGLIDWVDETIFSGEGVIYIENFGTFHACKETGGTAFTRYFMQVNDTAIINPEKQADADEDLKNLVKERNANW